MKQANKYGAKFNYPLWPYICSYKSSSFPINLFCFGSPLLTEYLLVSFPLSTEMFQFDKFVIFYKYLSIKICFPMDIYRLTYNFD